MPGRFFIGRNGDKADGGNPALTKDLVDALQDQVFLVMEEGGIGAADRNIQRSFRFLAFVVFTVADFYRLRLKLWPRTLEVASDTGRMINSFLDEQARA